jgi:hypothetical protein
MLVKLYGLLDGIVLTQYVFRIRATWSKKSESLLTNPSGLLVSCPQHSAFARDKRFMKLALLILIFANTGAWTIKRESITHYDGSILPSLKREHDAILMRMLKVKGSYSVTSALFSYVIVLE